jgi:hypothetical protein
MKSSIAFLKEKLNYDFNRGLTSLYGVETFKLDDAQLMRCIIELDEKLTRIEEKLEGK